MNATWRNFEDYLKNNIIFLSTSNNQNSKDAEYIILKDAKQKYELDNYTELIQVLSNFLLSSKCSHTNTYEECYPLPQLTYRGEGGKTMLKKWDELFPRRTETKFGKKNSSNNEISPEVWEVLKEIYKEWSKTKLHPTGLEKEADEIIMLVLETASKQKYSRIVRKHPNLKSKMEKWLNEYEKLTTIQKRELEKDKKLIQKDYDIICSLKDNLQEPTLWERAKDFKNWPWLTISISAVVVTIGLFLYWGVRKILGTSS